MYTEMRGQKYLSVRPLSRKSIVYFHELHQLCEKLTVIHFVRAVQSKSCHVSTSQAPESVQRRETPVRNSTRLSECRSQCNLYVLFSNLNGDLHRLVTLPASSSFDKICSDVEILACCCQWTGRLFRRCGRRCCAAGCHDRDSRRWRSATRDQ